MAAVKCGLEIHQQLDTKKLFCECPSMMIDGTAHYTVERRLRAVVGETGEVDVAAAEEAMKKKTFVYEAFDDNCCLVELDEEPPRGLRREALNAAIMVGKLFDARFVDEAQVMRKTVVDGSNTTGFQRTALVAHSGKIDSSNGPVSIPTVIVEEDSARAMRDTKDTRVFRLDRLGVPLLEVSTGPDITSPEQCAEVAEKLGLLLRSTGLVKRGLGTIRQDVNVSIKGGERVEIKGAQDLKLLPKLVELEAQRQERLLEVRTELAKRKVRSVLSKPANVGELLKNSKSKVIAATISKGGVVLGVLLPGFKGLLGKELQPKRRVGTELSDRAKVAAGVGGIFHSDELPNYGILPGEVEQVAKKLKCGSRDAFVLVAADRARAERAMDAVVRRANEAIEGVPREVRAANPDGTTRFLRPMPGAARMYPETDVLPVRMTKEMIAAVPLPELIGSKVKRYENLGLGRDLAALVAKSDRAQLFDKLVRKFKKVKPAYLAEILLTAERTIRRQFDVDISPSDEDFEALFMALERGELAKESVLGVLKENKPVKDVLPAYRLMSDAEVKKVLQRIVRENKGAPFNALVGKAMAELRGKASGRKVTELLKKIAK